MKSTALRLSGAAATRAPTPYSVTLGEGEDTDRVYAIVDATGAVIVRTDSGVYPPNAETAAFIVRACNAHDALVAALREIAELDGRDDCGCLDEWTEAEAFSACKEIARDALAKAGAA